MTGSPISLSFHTALLAHRGKLLFTPGLGTPVFAASYIRKRKIVLEIDLLSHPNQLKLILTHEIFHFVWVRMANTSRNEFAALLWDELRNEAKGELGESADVKKAALIARNCETNPILSPASILDRAQPLRGGRAHSRGTKPLRPASAVGRWRDYVCESFCDTAAWFYAGMERNNAFTLAKRWQKRRADWFRLTFDGSIPC